MPLIDEEESESLGGEDVSCLGSGGHGRHFPWMPSKRTLILFTALVSVSALMFLPFFLIEDDADEVEFLEKPVVVEGMGDPLIEFFGDNPKCKIFETMEEQFTDLSLQEEDDGGADDDDGGGDDDDDDDADVDDATKARLSLAKQVNPVEWQTPDEDKEYEWNWKDAGRRLRYQKYAEAVQECVDHVDQKEAQCGGEKEEHYKLNWFEDVMLQLGWFVAFLVIMVALPTWVWCVRKVARSFGPHFKTDEKFEGVRMFLDEETFFDQVYNIVWGRGIVGLSLNIFIIFAAIFNFYAFAQKTEHTKGIEEEKYNDDDNQYHFLRINLGHPTKLNAWTVYSTGAFFVLITLLRFCLVFRHPFWGKTSFAPLFYCMGNMYIQIELFALVITCIDLFRDDDKKDMNFLFLFAFRLVEMFELRNSKRRKGIVQSIGRSLAHDKWRILVPYVINFCVWFFFAGLYYGANSDIPNAPDEALWEAVAYPLKKGGDPESWRRFQSMPSSMFFVLQNLAKEVPLADAHQTWSQRFVVSLITFLILPMFALPIGVLENSLLKVKDDEDEDGMSLQEEEVEQGKQLLKDPADKWKAIMTAILIMIPILMYFDCTMGGTDHEKYRVLKTKPQLLGVVDLLVGVMFAFEFIANLSEGSDYLLSKEFLVDLLSSIPGIAHGFYVIINKDLDKKGRFNDLIVACVIVRMLKMERYIGAFRMIFDVYAKFEALVQIAFVITGLLWMTFTMLFYKADQDNPDEDQQEQYGSLVRAGWAEIIQLHGEFPWCDYWPFGRTLCALSSYFAGVLFCIPISLASTGFQELVAAEHADDQDETRMPWPAEVRPKAENSLARWSYDLLYAHLVEDENVQGMMYKATKYTSVLLAFLSIGVGIISSVKDETVDDKFWKDSHEVIFYTGYVIDIMTVVWFSVILVFHVLALGITHFMTVPGLCDIISIAAIACSFGGKKVRKDVLDLKYKEEDGFLQEISMFRMCRLTALDSYIHSRHIVWEVLRKNSVRFLKACYALVTSWFFHGTLLFLFEGGDRIQYKKLFAVVPDGPVKGEKWNNDKNPTWEHFKIDVAKGIKLGSELDPGEFTQTERFASLPRGLQYSLLHLFGDYPHNDYNFSSKIVHWVGILFGIGILASYIGLFSAGFVEALNDRRRKDLEVTSKTHMLKLERAIRTVQRGIRSWITRRRSGVKLEHSLVEISTFKRFCTEVYSLSSLKGQICRGLFQFNTVLNLTLLFVTTLPVLQHEWNPGVQKAFLLVEVFQTCFFALEAVVLYFGIPKGPDVHLKTHYVVMVVGILVGIVKVILGFADPTLRAFAWFEGFLAIRVFQILRFPVFGRDMLLIREAVADAFPMLLIPMFLSLNVWCWGAVLYHWSEGKFKNESPLYEDFGNLADSLYWLSIFSIGEWASQDFSYIGSILSIATTLIVVALFGLPVGIMVEAVQKVLEDNDVEEQIFKMYMQGDGPPDLKMFKTKFDLMRRGSCQEPEWHDDDAWKHPRPDAMPDHGSTRGDVEMSRPDAMPDHGSTRGDVEMSRPEVMPDHGSTRGDIEMSRRPTQQTPLLADDAGERL